MTFENGKMVKIGIFSASKWGKLKNLALFESGKKGKKLI